MQYDPSAVTLLNAVAEFLQKDVRPLVKDHDPAMAFRLLIAANLTRIVSGELATEDMLDGAELERLQALLPTEAEELGEVGRGRSERQGAIRRLNEALVHRIRSGDDDFLARARAHVRQALAEKLAVSNPRFDTCDEIE